MSIDRDPREWVILEEDDKHVVFSIGKARVTDEQGREHLPGVA